jgi:hypothetical protein
MSAACLWPHSLSRISPNFYVENQYNQRQKRDLFLSLWGTTRHVSP